MNAKTAYSDKKSAEEVVDEIRNEFKDIEIKMLVFFASSIFAPDELSQKLQEAFTGCQVFGCTTAGEIISGKMLKNSVVAMAFDSEVIEDVRIEVLENIKEEDNVKKVFSSFEEYYKMPMTEMDFKKYVGIILIDGLCGVEEKIVDKIGDLTNILFVGGSAGDDLKFSSTYVFANGKAFSNGAVIALLKPRAGFEIIKTQSFCIKDTKLTATKANEDKREVLEFNNKPASLAYAEAIGKPVEDAHNFFMHNPVGLIIDGEPYVRSPQQIKGNKMVFYCNVVEGMEVSLLESTDIVKDTKEVIENKKKEIDNISGIINFHCILRTLELEQKGQEEEYGKIFSDIPTIGFSTYGEIYMGHVNQTSTMLVFK
ncbi:FIST signal transduction protein [candidate division KSB1 bacterium]